MQEEQTAEAEEELLSKHQAFADKVLVGEKQTIAYMEIYPDSTYAAAAVSAHDLLKKPNIQAYIAKRREEASRRCQLTVDDILLLWKGWAYAPEGELSLDAEVKNTLHGEDVGEGKKFYKAPDRMKASENIAKHLGMCPNTKVELTGANGDAIQHRHSTYEIVDAPTRDPIKESEKKEDDDS